MIIRRMTDADVSSVAEMILANWDTVMSRYHSPAVVAKFREEVTPDWLKRQMGWKRVLVAEDEGEIVATGALADFGKPDAPRLSVSQFFVHPRWHSRGIGKRLLGHLVQMARAGGVGRLHVPSSRNAVRFYAAAGFVADAAQPDVDDEITWMTLDLKAGVISQ